MPPGRSLQKHERENIPDLVTFYLVRGFDWGESVLVLAPLLFV